MRAQLDDSATAVSLSDSDYLLGVCAEAGLEPLGVSLSSSGTVTVSIVPIKGDVNYRLNKVYRTMDLDRLWVIDYGVMPGMPVETLLFRKAGR